jgi:hypothetical protein
MDVDLDTAWRRSLPIGGDGAPTLWEAFEEAEGNWRGRREWAGYRIEFVPDQVINPGRLTGFEREKWVALSSAKKARRMAADAAADTSLDEDSEG